MKTLIACLLVILSCSLWAQDIRITGLEWAPYTSGNQDASGFFTEIVTTCFENAGKSVDITIQDWNQALELTIDGKYDVIMTIYKTAAREKDLIFSDVVIESPLVFMKRKFDDISWTTLDDVKPYSIGIVKGYAYSEEFDQRDDLTKKVFTSDQQSLDALIGNEIDLALLDKFVGMNYLIQKSSQLLKVIEVLEPPLESKDLYIAASRKNPDSQKMIDAFNQELAKLRENGGLEAILERHGF